MKPSSSKRKSGEALDADKRLEIVSELAAINGQSKMGLVKTLKTLHDKGLLVDALVETPTELGYKRQVRRAFEKDALYTQTPYGTMLSQMELPVVDEKMKAKQPSMWYINPFALLFQLCATDVALFNLIKDAVGIAGTKALRIVLYFDGVNPGNPLAPDPQQLLQAIYWCFVDLPNWFLRRKDGWFCFSLTREIWIKDMAGGMSEFCKMVVGVFFSAVGDSFHEGITIQCGAESVVLRATFAGFLADEKGLKELFSVKGQAGNIMCMNCLNVRNRWCTLKPGEQHFWDPDISQRKPATSQHIRAMVRRISEEPGKTKRERLEMGFGINYVPTGLLWEHHLMTNILDPCRNYIRDWMHTFVSGGVAGTHLAMICGALHNIGIGIEIVHTYAQNFKLPRSRGSTVSDLYFKQNLVTTDHVKMFASDVLGMVCIMYAFLIDKIQPRGLLETNIECFAALFVMLCILRRGDMSNAIHITLTAITLKHNRLFLDLYGNNNVKIKFHHTYHMPDDMLYLMKCLSCFPAERKNKDAIAVSKANTTHIEKASVISFLHRTIDYWNDSKGCREMYVNDPRAVAMHGQRLYKAASATLACGEVHINDMVFLVDGSIGKVRSFYQHDECIYVGVDVHKAISHATLLFEIDVHEVQFIDARSIVEPVFWHAKETCILAVVPKCD